MAMALSDEWSYHQTIKAFASEAEPPFESAEQQRRVWGREWGCPNDVGTLRVVLLCRPPDDLATVVDTSKWDSELEAYADREAGWYWRHREPPDLKKMREQHDDQRADRSGRHRRARQRRGRAAGRGGAAAARCGAPEGGAERLQAAHRRRVRDGRCRRRADQSDRPAVLVPREAEGPEGAHGRVPSRRSAVHRELPRRAAGARHHEPHLVAHGGAPREGRRRGDLPRL